VSRWTSQVGATTEWYTPPSIFNALGVTFDLDVASPVGGLPWIPARRFLSLEEDALACEWSGLVWMNPPYGPGIDIWIERFIDHANGISLLAARTETRWWQRVADKADAITFLKDRVHFVRLDGFTGRPDHSSVLVAIGAPAVEALRRAQLGWTYQRTVAR
jgi:hypothetical protein